MKSIIDGKQMRIIEIEGLDGTGKETVSKALVEKLRYLGFNVAHVSFPRYNSLFGAAVKCTLDGEFGPLPEFDPFLSGANYTLDRISYFKKALPELKAQGIDFLILDRGFYSNFMYQAAKLKIGEVTKWICDNYNHEFRLSGLAPCDLQTFVLLLNGEDREKQISTRASLDTNEKDLKYLNMVSNFVRYMLTAIGRKEMLDRFSSHMEYLDPATVPMCESAYIKYIHDVYPIEVNSVEDLELRKVEIDRVVESILVRYGLDNKSNNQTSLDEKLASCCRIIPQPSPEEMLESIEKELSVRIRSEIAKLAQEVYITSYLENFNFDVNTHIYRISKNVNIITEGSAFVFKLMNDSACVIVHLNEETFKQMSFVDTYLKLRNSEYDTLSKVKKVVEEFESEISLLFIKMEQLAHKNK